MAAPRARGRALPALLALALLPLVLPGASAQGEVPVAFFTLSPARVATGSTVTADAALSAPSLDAANLTEYAWRWSETDEYLPGNATERHAYRQAGVFVVGLRVTDDAGRVAFANQSVLVVGSLPSAYFTLRETERDGGVEVRVDGTFSEPSRGASRIVQHEWDWGTGEGFFVGNVTEMRFYETPGNYTVRHRVTDDQGRVSEERLTVDVTSTFVTRLGVVLDEWEAFLLGARLTLYLAVVTTVLGFVAAVLLALLRISRFPFLRWPATAYIEVIRGTPLLVQILVAWLVLPFVGLKLPILWAGALALVVNTSAYQAEAIRGGIQGIPAGQMEAATSLGMTYLQAMRHVVFPQAFRLTLPALGNEFIILLKDTSLVSVIGVIELTKVGTIFAARTFLVLETFLVVAAIYFVMTYTLSLGLRRLERRLAIPGLGAGGAHG